VKRKQWIDAKRAGPFRAATLIVALVPQFSEAVASQRVLVDEGRRRGRCRLRLPGIGHARSTLSHLRQNSIPSCLQGHFDLLRPGSRHLNRQA
jgi:hypothetical protein